MSEKEIKILHNLIKKSNYPYIGVEMLRLIEIEDANDGDMGSFIIKSNNSNRKLGEIIATSEFNDLDGVKVLVSLSVDNYGDFYEVDIWKTDFTKLISLPSD